MKALKVFDLSLIYAIFFKFPDFSLTGREGECILKVSVTSRMAENSFSGEEE